MEDFRGHDIHPFKKLMPVIDFGHGYSQRVYLPGMSLVSLAEGWHSSQHIAYRKSFPGAFSLHRCQISG